MVNNGDAADAVPVLVDAVEKSRLLLKNDPYEVRFLPLALHNLAMALSSVRNWESALLVSEESERLYGQLVSKDAASYSEHWHKTRDLLAYILDALGRQEEASVMRSKEL